MVCYMYYTDVFLGSVNIDKLKSALNAELGSSELNGDLTQLVHGLCLFLGYPSCLCSLKVNVDKSLQDISQKLIQDFKAVQSCVNSQTLNLNCNSCNSNEILCKCCVISCIKELRDKCECVQKSSQSCQCSGTNGKCCKDFLSGLEACLSLLNLKTDLAACDCNGDTCCETGQCTNKCKVCDPDKSTITGLGLSRPNPVRLAKRLSDMLCGTQKSGQKCSCDCGSGSSNTSCCCFCHNGCTTKNLSDLCSKSCPGCSCSKSGQCGLKAFCKSINTIRVLVGSKEMTCCDGGKNCHCQLEGSSKCSGSGCCVVKASSGNDHYQHSVKCMILRVVKFFASFDASSSSKCSKLCCELICVGKYCDFLKMFYDKGGKDKCGTCNSKGSNCPGSKIKTQSTSCCGGNPSDCSNSDCCLGCQDCDAIKFRKALETLKLSSPCGQDLYRTLKDFLDYCLNVAEPFIKSVKEKINAAKGKCVSGCNSASQSKTPCSCSQTSGSCLGCQEIREKHNDIMAILAGGYSSAYSSNAKWDSLCQKSSGPCCGQSSCPQDCSSSNPSCPSKCCEKCPKRLCAKIFLGMLPCLYYGLKILWVRCKDGSEFPGWNQKNIPEALQLRKFLEALGFSFSHLNSSLPAGHLPGLLEKLFGSSGVFDKLYDFVSKKYFSPSVSPGSISPNSSPPTTVRQMLLWLYGLRFQKHFSDLVENCKSLCLPFGNSFHPEAFCYYIYTCCFLLPVSVISVIQCPDGSPSFLPSHSDWTSFSYPDDLSSLFEKLCEYARKIFVALNFLCIQCKNDRNSAGWNDCAFGQRCAEKFQEISSTSGFTSSSGCSSCKYSGAYLCTAINKDPVHDHCNGSASTQKSCLGFGSTSTSCSGSSAHPQSKTKTACTPCPHPLMRFLCDSDSKSKSKALQNFRTPFHLPGTTPMGFKDLSSTARDGWSLYAILTVFCEDGFYPLTRLAEFALCVSLQPPDTLGELFAFFKKFVSSNVFKNNFVEWINGEPGFYSGSDLTNAMKDLYGSHSGSHSDLKSLYDCSGSSCGKYLYSLTENAYKDFIEGFLDTYLSFVCHLGPTFEKKLKEFQEEFSSSSCCSSGSCQKIVECPCALPKFYAQGFVYYSPHSLNTNNKICSDFIAQLGKVVGKGSPLQDLLDAIDAFIWSIRFPFFFGFLYVWFFVLSYFCYVILIKLDTFHTGSHLHLPRSFKILPSTLFSDASSKLKDLSYFTL
ncbi:variant erythrocyte surface antigen-1 family protein [Babesia divergens]|uniref:Variant erythrocyte surface antigen-1 family protein n=1 Tax=Babesia divergens TaxID=32595 RepID=A0AAD9G5J3_BABDI|nr:variant erythrocyte surface antigen-1 family protein [Babesia divergens]